ncbi:MAG: hypothetical protein P8Z30_09035 [Acidobacteriota bacterium]
MSDTLQRQESITTSLDPFVGANIRLWDPNVMPAIMEQWNFGVERQFPNQIRLSVLMWGNREHT